MQIEDLPCRKAQQHARRRCKSSQHSASEVKHGFAMLGDDLRRVVRTCNAD